MIHVHLAINNMQSHFLLPVHTVTYPVVRITTAPVGRDADAADDGGVLV